MSDGYSSTYTLHNRLRQDSFAILRYVDSLKRVVDQKAKSFYFSHYLWALLRLIVGTVLRTVRRRPYNSVCTDIDRD
jgi:hypothetical protein